MITTDVTTTYDVIDDDVITNDVTSDDVTKNKDARCMHKYQSNY